jgi:hypothetical protein
MKHVYSTRFDTFLRKMVLERDGKVIAHLRSEAIANDLVKKLNDSFGEDDSIVKIS